MAEKPDFEALRQTRNTAMQEAVNAIADKWGWDPSNVYTTFNPDACYCACPKGPCEHDFQGWRDFEDGSGGERICSRCGCGAMHHGLMTSE